MFSYFKRLNVLLMKACWKNGLHIYGKKNRIGLDVGKHVRSVKI